MGGEFNGNLISDIVIFLDMWLSKKMINSYEINRKNSLNFWFLGWDASWFESGQNSSLGERGNDLDWWWIRFIVLNWEKHLQVNYAVKDFL